MFEKVTVCHLLPQRAGAGDKAVAGKKETGTGGLAGNAAGSAGGKRQPAVGCKRAISRGRTEGK